MRIFRRKQNERGAAAVEFALVLPVLLLLVFGIIEFGLLFNRYITLTHAAREGVRVAALTGSTVDPVTFKTQGETAAESSAPDIVSDISCVQDNSVPLEVTMTCTTTYDFALFIITDEIDLSSTAKMRNE